MLLFRRPRAPDHRFPQRTAVSSAGQRCRQKLRLYTASPIGSSREEHRNPFIAEPEWWNWQTRRIQNPLGVTSRAGSSPASGTDFNASRPDFLLVAGVFLGFSQATQ